MTALSSLSLHRERYMYMWLMQATITRLESMTHTHKERNHFILNFNVVYLRCYLLCVSVTVP